MSARTLGNCLIIGSLGIFAYLYLPLLRLYFPQQPFQPVPVSSPESLFLYIPKISAAAPIILQVDPWDAKEYREKLKLGVAHARGSKLPGEPGTSYLFAHSSDYPWNLTRYNTAFFRLGELTAGDRIRVVKNGQPLNYQVTAIKVVWPTQVEALTQPSATEQLVLQTCTPIGTSLKRLLVFASRVD